MAAIESVEGYKPYDDTELLSKMQKLEIENNGFKDRFLTLSDSTNKLTEKVATVSVVATEAKVLAESTSRETNSRLLGIKQEMESTSAALRNEMNSLKRATTNPLGR
jgi:hypothetical protein